MSQPHPKRRRLGNLRRSKSNNSNNSKYSNISDDDFATELNEHGKRKRHKQMTLKNRNGMLFNDTSTTTERVTPIKSSKKSSTTNSSTKSTKKQSTTREGSFGTVVPNISVDYGKYKKGGKFYKVSFNKSERNGLIMIHNHSQSKERQTKGKANTTKRSLMLSEAVNFAMERNNAQKLLLEFREEGRKHKKYVIYKQKMDKLCEEGRISDTVREFVIKQSKRLISMLRKDGKDGKYDLKKEIKEIQSAYRKKYEQKDEDLDEDLSERQESIDEDAEWTPTIDISVETWNAMKNKIEFYDEDPEAINIKQENSRMHRLCNVSITPSVSLSVEAPDVPQVKT